jgi:hypothetical protein
VPPPPQVEGTLRLNRPGRRPDKPKGRIGRIPWMSAGRVQGRLGIRSGEGPPRSASTLGQPGEEARLHRTFRDLRGRLWLALVRRWLAARTIR